MQISSCQMPFLIHAAHYDVSGINTETKQEWFNSTDNKYIQHVLHMRGKSIIDFSCY